MVMIAFVIGVAVGWLLHLASDYLPRYSVSKTAVVTSFTFAPPVLVQLVTGRRSQQAWAALHLGVELGTGLFFALIWAELGYSLALLFAVWGYIFFMLIAIIDIKYRLVLNVLTYPAIMALLTLNWVAQPQQMLNIVLGGGLAFGIFFLTAWLRPGELGGGDIKLATLIGVAFGFPNMLLALLVGALIGGVAVVYLVVKHQMGWKSQIPYAPFLCFGAMALLLSHSLFLLQ